MKHITIRHSSLPTKPPILSTIVIWLMLDRLNASDLVLGIVWTVWALICISFIFRWYKEERRDVSGFGDIK